MTTTNRNDAYKLAVDAAQAELAELNAKLAEMEPVVRRKAIVEAFLQNASALQGIAAGNGGTATTIRVEAGETVLFGDSVAVDLVPGGKKNLWEGARDVLASAKHPMTVPWIVKAMGARGWKFKAKWTTEIVRGSIQRKPEVFESRGKGFYALREWPNEMKKLSRDLEFKARHGFDPTVTIQSFSEDFLKR